MIVHYLEALPHLYTTVYTTPAKAPSQIGGACLDLSRRTFSLMVVLDRLLRQRSSCFLIRPPCPNPQFMKLGLF